MDVPLFYSLPGLCGTLHCVSPPQLAVRSALLHLGHRVSISHCDANAIKTDAPHHVVWDIMRTWVAANPVKYISPHSPAAPILARAVSTPNISFERHPDALAQSKERGISRFPENPQPNWGPKAKAGKRYVRASRNFFCLSLLMISEITKNVATVSPKRARPRRLRSSACKATARSVASCAATNFSTR
jgi:hypothetical protein